MNVFLNYRRDDTLGWTGRIADRLGQDHRVFRDVTSIAKGASIEDSINRALRRTDVLLAIIGKDWLIENPSTGRPRLFDEADYVRREVELAFSKEVPVLPVLVESGKMPKASNLPESLTPLTDINAILLRDDSFGEDIAKLLAFIEGHQDIARRQRWRIRALRLAVTVSFLAFLAVWTGILDILNLQFYSQLSTTALGNMARPGSSPEDVCIVAFPSPPDRNAHADVIDVLSKAQAKVIGIDVFFKEKEKSGLSESEIKHLSESTQALAEAIRQAKARGTRVVCEFRGKGSLTPELKEGDSYLCEQGFANLRDGPLGFRSELQLADIRDRADNLLSLGKLSRRADILPSLPLALAAAFQDLSIDGAVYDPKQDIWPRLLLGKTHSLSPYQWLKKERVATSWLEIAPQATTYSYEDIMSQQTPTNFFSGKIVLLGGMVEGLDEHWVVSAFPEQRWGVDIHASMTAALVSALSGKRPLIRQPNWDEQLLVLLAFCALGAVFRILTFWYPPRRRFWILALPMGLYALWVAWAYAHPRVLYGLFEGLLILGAIYWAVGERYFNRHYHETSKQA